MVIAVVAVLTDKDVAGILQELSKSVDYLIATQNESIRAMAADELAKIAASYFKPEQIEVITDLNSAITYALEKATLSNQVSDGVTSVLITGSVITAGSARSILRRMEGSKK
jgi:dihydrofolate synthase/folylpolyglutamate synthase